MELFCEMRCVYRDVAYIVHLTNTIYCLSNPMFKQGGTNFCSLAEKNLPREAQPRY